MCIDSSGDDVILATPSETACTTEDSTNTWHTTEYYDYISGNNSATIKAKDGTGAEGCRCRREMARKPARNPSSASVTVQWEPVPTVNGVPVTHYQLERSASPWERIADNVPGATYTDFSVQPGKTYRYRVRAVNGAEVEGPWSLPIEASAPEPLVVTRTVDRDGTDGTDGSSGSGSGSSRSRDDDDDPYARFATLETTRSVAEHSVAGSPVGNPVAAQASPGNRITYYLEGKDARLFDIEPDSGQILVGDNALLDYEAETNTYTVVVVADPRRGSNDRVTVTINVTDAPETGTLSLSPGRRPSRGPPADRHPGAPGEQD